MTRPDQDFKCRHNVWVPPCFLLDLDGTLIDSEPWYKQAEVDVLCEFGVSINVHDMDRFTGVILPVWLKRICDEHGTEVSLSDYLARIKPRMLNHVENDIELFSDVIPFFELIGDSPAMLVTSSMDWYVQAVLDRYPVIRDRVEGIVCEAHVKQGKPHPEPYLLASERLKVSPSECLVFEDAVNGVLSGKHSGARVFGIDRESRGHLGMADVVLTSLTEFNLSLSL